MFTQNRKKSDGFPPTMNQQTGQWHFYDDEGKPVDLKKPRDVERDDCEPAGCCFSRKR